VPILEVTEAHRQNRTFRIVMPSESGIARGRALLARDARSASRSKIVCEPDSWFVVQFAKQSDETADSVRIPTGSRMAEVSKPSPGAIATGSDSAGAPSPFKAPAVTLPKGGGAIRGIGEKFAANPVTGTGSLSIPIYTSPGRSGFGPQLSLSYDSGAGNGPFGFGWSLSLPSITRKTDKGLPRYQDVEESDVFILSGAEDLVPVLTESGERHSDDRTVNGVSYTVQRYRPP
jgi:Salmonella virulence plasmid 65kDa B protein